MNLLSVRSSFPKHYYTQEECLEAMRSADFWNKISATSKGLLEKVLSGDNGIDGRHFCLDKLEKAWQMTAQELNEYYEENAPKLAANAVQKALDSAGVEANDIDALFLCSCTGFLCPGVSSYVAEILDMREDVFHQDQTGLGCGAAIPLLRSAKSYLAHHSDAVVITVAVEVCSAAFFVENDIGVLISMCLFGDGASAAIWCGDTFQSSVAPSWKVDHFQSLHIPSQREKIRFTNSDGKLRNQLHRSVPELAGDTVAKLYAKKVNEPQQWITHGGGKDVINQLEKVLPTEGLHYARKVMQMYGNLSSPSILLALEMCLSDIETDVTDHVSNLWLCSFGAGFSAHSCELYR